MVISSNTPPKLISTLGILLCLSSALPLLSASDSSPSANAFSVPLSDKVIQVEILGPQGEKITRAAVRDGTMLTIEDEAAGKIYGFLPHFDHEQLYVIPFVISNLLNAGQKARQAGKSQSLPLSRQVAFPNLGNLSLRVLSTAVWEFPNIPNLRPSDTRRMPAELQKIYGKAGGGICCVTCSKLTACATAVEMDCGVCNSAGGAPRFN